MHTDSHCCIAYSVHVHIDTLVHMCIVQSWIIIYRSCHSKELDMGFREDYNSLSQVKIRTKPLDDRLFSSLTCHSESQWGALLSCIETRLGLSFRFQFGGCYGGILYPVTPSSPATTVGYHCYGNFHMTGHPLLMPIKSLNGLSFVRSIGKCYNPLCFVWSVYCLT